MCEQENMKVAEGPESFIAPELTVNQLLDCVLCLHFCRVRDWFSAEHIFFIVTNSGSKGFFLLSFILFYFLVEDNCLLGCCAM
jgi:hypothetical protein